MENIITKNLIPIILCGGAGSRLWPVSRENHPKPFIKLKDGQSLLQKAYLRGAMLDNVSNIITVTNQNLAFQTQNEYQKVSKLVVSKPAKSEINKPINNTIILEPTARNTAAAIALATIQAAEDYGSEAILLILAADHLILDQQAFYKAVNQASQLAQKGKLVTFGIQPTSPETGYGYIKFKQNKVINFIEKPTLDKAIDYVSSGNYLWNSGMFCFKATTMLQEMAQHSPDTLNASQLCLQQSKALTKKATPEPEETPEKTPQKDTFNLIKLNPESFNLIPDSSIDYAIMEKTTNIAVVPCNIGWSDVGCWNSFGSLVTADNNGNRITGNALIEDSKNCTIHSQSRAVGLVGVNNLIIVDTPDALLIANKDKAQDVKKIYTQLKEKNHQAYKIHRTVQRPWGNYTVLEEGTQFKIKRIEVNQGARLSLQSHQHRSEHWVVISGIAGVLCGENKLTLKANESTFIPAQEKHYLENQGTELLIIIEVQTGTYLGEDDIIRYEDLYGRE